MCENAHRRKYEKPALYPRSLSYTLSPDTPLRSQHLYDRPPAMLQQTCGSRLRRRGPRPMMLLQDDGATIWI